MLAGAWSLACYGLLPAWIGHPHYGYGWCVPLLAAYFAFRRLGGAPGACGGNLAGIGMAFAAGLFIPLRVIADANPDWRLALGALVSAAGALTVAMAVASGGWPLGARMVFPALFPLCAVPWPTGVERELVGALTRWNAMAGVEFLAWSGIGATREGNVIRTASGSVGVDEACGGIGGLQVGVMLALAAGEWARARLAVRALLVVAAFPVAAGLNWMRTLVLVSLLSRSGEAGVERYHDVIGMVFLVLQIGAMVYLGRLALGKTGEEAFSSASPAAPPRWAAAASAVLLAVAACAPAGWSLIRAGGGDGSGWVFDPRPEEGWKHQPLPSSTRAVLGADEAFAFTGQTAEGRRWVVFCIGWEAGNIRAIPARAHAPDVCLIGRSGLSLEADRGVIRIGAGGMALPFRSFVFGNGHRAWTVYFGAFSGRDPEGGVPDAGRRLRWAWEGRRNEAYRTVEFCLTGRADDAEMQAAFGPVIARLISVP